MQLLFDYEDTCFSLYSGEVHSVKGVERSLSAGQVVWAPSGADSQQGLVFAGWSAEARKLGVVYCYNRPCALYFIQCPFGKSEANQSATSPDGKSLVFVSVKSAVESGAHNATNSLHRIDWTSDFKGGLSHNIINAVPAVMCPKDSSFPGLYCSTFLTKPWLSYGRSMILSSMWGSDQGTVERVTPPNPGYSWNLLALDEDNILAGVLLDLVKKRCNHFRGKLDLRPQLDFESFLNIGNHKYCK